MKNSVYMIAVGLLLLFFSVSYFRPTATFSEIENRYLTDFIRPDPESVLQSEWQEQITKAANDQVIFRDWFAELTVAAKLLFGQRDIGGVYFGKDGYYMEKVLDSDVSLVQYEKNLQMVDQAMKAAERQTLVCLVPSSGVILKEKLPEGASIYQEEPCYQTGEKIFGDSWLDIRSFLRDAAEKEQVYFRTDHHWTTYGAYVGAAAFLQAAEREKSTVELQELATSGTAAENFHPNNLLPIEAYGLQEAEEKFYGTLYSKAPWFKAEADPLIIPKKLGTCQVTIDDGEVRNSIYQNEYLTQKDKYAVYFGGNYGTVRIRANAESDSKVENVNQTITNQKKKGQSGKKLLIIKDSYANSMIPYLISSYDEILMIDLRYYNASFQDMIQEEQPDTILVLYEMTSFMKSDTLFKMLR